MTELKSTLDWSLRCSIDEKLATTIPIFSLGDDSYWIWTDGNDPNTKAWIESDGVTLEPTSRLCVVVKGIEVTVWVWRGFHPAGLMIAEPEYFAEPDELSYFDKTVTHGKAALISKPLVPGNLETRLLQGETVSILDKEYTADKIVGMRLLTGSGLEGVDPHHKVKYLEVSQITQEVADFIAEREIVALHCLYECKVDKLNSKVRATNVLIEDLDEETVREYIDADKIVFNSGESGEVTEPFVYGCTYVQHTTTEERYQIYSQCGTDGFQIVPEYLVMKTL